MFVQIDSRSLHLALQLNARKCRHGADREIVERDRTVVICRRVGEPSCEATDSSLRVVHVAGACGLRRKLQRRLIQCGVHHIGCDHRCCDYRCCDDRGDHSRHHGGDHVHGLGQRQRNAYLDHDRHRHGRRQHDGCDHDRGEHHHRRFHHGGDHRRNDDAFAMFTKAPPSFTPHWSVWATAFGGSQATDGNTALGSNNTTSNVAATAVGADYLIAPHTIAGFALAGGGTSFSVANGGSGRSDLFQAGAYLRHSSGPAYISAALAYGWQDITTNRTVSIAGTDQLRAQFNANAWSGRAEGGYRFVAPVGGLGITPYAAAQFVAFNLPAYAEQAVAGSNVFALAYGARNATDVRTELGLRSDKSFAVADGILTLRGRFAWAHDYNTNRAIAATFQALPAAGFVVNGAAQASESALTTASIEMTWKQGWSLAATFEGEFSDVTTSYGGKGTVRYSW